jgi:hypothetical protein
VSTTNRDIKQPLGDEPDYNHDLQQWIPIVIPLLALLIVLDTCLIAWGVLVYF